jgi:hypothetical protein
MIVSVPEGIVERGETARTGGPNPKPVHLGSPTARAKGSDGNRHTDFTE